MTESKSLAHLPDGKAIGIDKDKGFVHPGQLVIDDVLYCCHLVGILGKDGCIETVIFFDVLKIPECLFRFPGWFRCLLAVCHVCGIAYRRDCLRNGIGLR